MQFLNSIYSRNLRNLLLLTSFLYTLSHCSNVTDTHHLSEKKSDGDQSIQSDSHSDILPEPFPRELFRPDSLPSDLVIPVLHQEENSSTTNTELENSPPSDAVGPTPVTSTPSTSQPTPTATTPIATTPVVSTTIIQTSTPTPTTPVASTTVVQTPTPTVTTPVVTVTPTPTPTVLPNSPIIMNSHLALGNDVGCFIVKKQLYCSGDNRIGNLGVGFASDVSNRNQSRNTPGIIEGINQASRVYYGGDFYRPVGCVIDANALKCWGTKIYRGNIADPDDYVSTLSQYTQARFRTKPTLIPTNDVVRDVAIISGSEICALVGSSIQCWKSDGSTRSIDVGFVPTAISGKNSLCAINEKKMKCFGYGLTSENASLHNLFSFTSNVLAIDSEDFSTCVITDESKDNMYCAGAYASATSPNGVKYNGAQKIVLGKKITAMTVAMSNTCAVAGGNLYCWGSKFVGDGTNIYRGEPTLADGSGQVTEVSTSKSYALFESTCYIANKAVKCFGKNGSNTPSGYIPGHGVFGSGDDLRALSPVATKIFDVDGDAPKFCDGKIVDGECWYAYEGGISCNTMCAGRGGVRSATATFAGASAANCTKVLASFGINSFNGGAKDGNTVKGYGCNWQLLAGGSYLAARDVSPINYDSRDPYINRVCACKN